MKKVNWPISIAIFLLGLGCVSRSHELIAGIVTTPQADTLETITARNVSQIKEVGKLRFSPPTDGLNWISALAVSPDSKMIACGDLLGLITLWDTETKSGIGMFRGHHSSILSLTFNPTGTLLASSSGDPDNLNADNSVRLWDIASHTQVAQIEMAYKQEDLAFSPDGKGLALGGFDGDIRLWDIDKQALIAEFKGHTNWVSQVLFTANGDLLASSSGDGTVRIWSVKERTPIRTLQLHDATWSMALKPNSSMVAAGNDGAVSIWDISTSTKLTRLTGYQGAVVSLKFSPDGVLLVSDGGFENPDYYLFIWDLASQAKYTLSGHSDVIERVLFSPDGKFIVSSSRDDTVRFWGVAGQS